jgi:hypothetical protein
MRVLVVAGVLWAGLLSAGPASAQAVGDLYDCGDFRFQEDAQAVFNAFPGDPFGLDGPLGPESSGVPGLACEDLPSSGTPQTATTISTPGIDTLVQVSTTTTITTVAPTTTTTVAPTTTTTAASSQSLARTGASGLTRQALRLGLLCVGYGIAVSLFARTAWVRRIS